MKRCGQNWLVLLLVATCLGCKLRPDPTADRVAAEIASEIGHQLNIGDDEARVREWLQAKGWDPSPSKDGLAAMVYQSADKSHAVILTVILDAEGKLEGSDVRISRTHF